MALTESLKVSITSNGQQILKSNWEQQPLVIRFVNWLGYGLLRLMTEISGYDAENSRTHDLTNFKDP